MRVLPRLAVFLAIASAAPCQRVTATAKVRIDGRVETVRKINGRWWAEDNRQLTPSKEGFIWWISSEKGKSWRFNHHRPVNLPLAESLHLFEDPASVLDLLGQPNEESGRDTMGSQMWFYYAEDGTALFVRFIRDELSDAQYQRHDYGIHGKPVGSVAADLGGRNVFKVFADRAWEQRSPAEFAKYRRDAAPASVVSIAPGSTRPDPPKRLISAELAESVKTGMPRAEVVRLFGEPQGGLAISGAENDSETMTYPLEQGGQLSLRLEHAKVVRITR